MPTTFVATDHSLLREAELKQVPQTVKAFTAVQMFAASNGLVAQYFFTMLRESAFSPVSRMEGPSLRNVQIKKRAATKTSFPQSV